MDRRQRHHAQHNPLRDSSDCGFTAKETFAVVIKGWIEGVAKVTGAKLYVSDFRARDMEVSLRKPAMCCWCAPGTQQEAKALDEAWIETGAACPR